MGQALIMRRDGNGIELRVAAYSSSGSLPASAKVGDIAIITSTAIGKTNFIGTQPSDPVAGDVWIKGTSSSLVYVTVKSNPLFVIYPMLAYQYNGSAWALKPIYVFVSTSWVAAGSMWLFGNSQNTVTMEVSSSGAAYVNGSVVYLASGPGAAPSYGGVRSSSTVDLTGSKRVVATFSSGELDRYRQIAITTGTAWNSGVVASVTLNNTTYGNDSYT